MAAGTDEDSLFTLDGFEGVCEHAGEASSIGDVAFPQSDDDDGSTNGMVTCLMCL